MRKIDGKEISSIIENARLLSSSERKIQAPKLYGIFGLDPYLYLASQEIGRKIRDEIDQRTRTTPDNEPMLDDVKTVGESKYIAAVGRAPIEDSGGSGGGGSRRGASKVSARGQGGGGDSGPHAAAHLARGRVITCYNYDKEGHYSRDCPEPRRPRTRHKFASRSPSSFHRRGRRQKGSGGGKVSKGSSDATDQAGTQQHSASAAAEIATTQQHSASAAAEIATLQLQL